MEEIVQQTDPKTDPPSLKVYNALSKDEKYKPYIPNTYEEFSLKMQDNEVSLKVYEALRKDERYSPYLSDEAGWLDAFSVKKKDETPASPSVASQDSGDGLTPPSLSNPEGSGDNKAYVEATANLQGEAPKPPVEGSPEAIMAKIQGQYEEEATQNSEKIYAQAQAEIDQVEADSQTSFGAEIDQVEEKIYKEIQDRHNSGELTFDQANELFTKRIGEEIDILREKYDKQAADLQKTIIDKYDKQDKDEGKSLKDKYDLQLRSEVEEAQKTPEQKAADELKSLKGELEKIEGRPYTSKGRGSSYRRDLTEEEQITVDRADELKRIIAGPVWAEGIKREYNPLATGGKSAWNVFSHQLPSTAHASVAASTSLLDKGTKMIREVLMIGKAFSGKPKYNPAEVRKQLAQIDNYKAEARYEIFKWAKKYQDEGVEYTEGLVNSMDKVDGPLDALNWVFNAFGQAVGQIPLSIATLGASSAIQEVGSVYMEGVAKIAEEKGITEKEVIEQNLDEPAIAMAYGLAAGSLEYVGAKNVMKSFSKDAFKKDLRQRAKVVIDGGKRESATEGAQTIIEQIGVSKQAGKTLTEAIAELNWDEVWEASAQGGVGGTGLSAVGQSGLGRKIASKIDEVRADKKLKKVYDEVKEAGKTEKTFDEFKIAVKEGNQVLKEKATKPPTEPSKPSEETSGFKPVKGKTSKDFKGKKVSLIHNTEKAPDMGSRFGQDVEPAGYYATQQEMDVSDIPNMETTETTLENPLVIEVTNDTLVEWKRELSKKYGGLTGKKLSDKLREEGYDSVVTVKDGMTGEIILLGGKTSVKEEAKPVVEKVEKKEPVVEKAKFKVVKSTEKSLQLEGEVTGNEYNIKKNNDGEYQVLVNGVPTQKFTTKEEANKFANDTELEQSKKEPENNSRYKFGEALEKKHGVKLDLYEDQKRKVLSLEKIEVPEDQRGQGVGSSVMQDIVDYADKMGYTILATPTADYGSTLKQVQNYNMKFGFVFNKGKNRDFSHKEDMYRLPVEQKEANAPKVKTKKDVENDPRVESMNEQTEHEDGTGTKFYVIRLKEGYVSDEGTRNISEPTVKELTEHLNRVKEKTEITDADLQEEARQRLKEGKGSITFEKELSSGAKITYTYEGGTTWSFVDSTGKKQTETATSGNKITGEWLETQVGKKEETTDQVEEVKPVVKEKKKVEKTEDQVEIERQQADVEHFEMNIENLQEEIANEKANLKTDIKKVREKIAAVRKKKMSKDEKDEAIDELQAEIQDLKDDYEGIIDGYKDDIRNDKSDLKKAQRVIAKLKVKETPVIEDGKSTVKPKLTLPVGISGSGKSTQIESGKLGKGEIISPDAIRRELTGNVSDQTQNKKVYEIAYQRVADALSKGKDVIFDATNLSSKDRSRLASYLKERGIDFDGESVVFESDPKVSKERVQKDIESGKDRSNVPEDIIDRQFSTLNKDLDKLESDGFPTKGSPLANIKEKIQDQKKESSDKLKDLATKFKKAGKGTAFSGLGYNDEQFAIAKEMVAEALKYGKLTLDEAIEWVKTHLGKDFEEYREAFTDAFPQKKEKRQIQKAKIYNNNAIFRDEIAPDQQIISEEGDVHRVLDNDLAIAEANRIVNENDSQTVFDTITDRENNMEKPLRERIAEALAVKFGNEGNMEMMNEVVKFRKKLGTESGQALQSLNEKNLNPEFRNMEMIAGVIENNKQKNKAKLAEVQSNGKTLDQNIKDSYRTVKGIVEKAGVQLTENDDVMEALGKLVEGKKPRKPTPPKTTRDKIKEAKAERKKLTEEYKNRKQDLFLSSAIPGLTPQGVEYVTKLAKTYIKEGVARVEEIVEKIADHMKKNFDKEIDKASIHKAVVEIKIPSEIKKYKEDIKQIVTEHYSKRGELKTTLAEKIAETFGVEDVTEITEQIEKAFEKELESQTKRVVNNMINSSRPKTTEKKRKAVYDRIIDAVNSGALDEQEYQDALAESLGLTEINNATVEKLKELAEKAQMAPEGFKKRRAIEDIMQELLLVGWQDSSMANQAFEVMLAMWYSHILSGPATHALNIWANVFETLGELFIQSARRPRDVGIILASWFQGLGRGGLEAFAVAKTGKSPVKGGKMEAPTIFESLGKGKWNAKNFIPLAYVGLMRFASTRVLSAADTFFFYGLQQVKAAELARDMARAERKGGKITLNNMGKPISPRKQHRIRAAEILHQTTSDTRSAKEQAYRESSQDFERPGLSSEEFRKKVEGSLDYKRRWREILAQKRDEDIMEDANDFAARGTFNYDPEGWLGGLSRAINSYSQDHPAIRFVVPFTRVIANVVNRYLEWTPYGYARVLRKKTGWGSKAVKLTDRQRQDIFIKASAGTAAMMALILMDDDDDFEITAAGPADIKKQYQLRVSGWRPYSVRIGNSWFSYRNTPLGIPLAVAGMWKDQERYTDHVDVGEKVFASVVAVLPYIMDQSFLRSMDEVFELMRGDPENLGRNAGRFFAQKGKNFIPVFGANAYSQTFRTIQEIEKMPTKQANNMWEYMVRDIPYLRDDLDNMYNVYGQPVVPDQLERFWPLNLSVMPDPDPVIDFVNESNYWVGSPTPGKFIIGDEMVALDQYDNWRPLYNKYKLLSAQGFYKGVNEQLEYLETLEKEDRKTALDAIRRVARIIAKDSIQEEISRFEYSR